MIIITVVTIAGILATVITGMTLHIINRDFMDSIINGTETNQDVIDVFDRVELFGTNIMLFCTVGGVVGLLVWWALSSQQRESVTGVY
jgi:hypothetical protein